MYMPNSLKFMHFAAKKDKNSSDSTPLLSIYANLKHHHFSILLLPSPLPAARVFKHSVLVLLVNQINHYFHHRIFLLGPTLRNHQRQRNQRVIGYALRPVFAIEDSVII